MSEIANLQTAGPLVSVSPQGIGLRLARVHGAGLSRPVFGIKAGRSMSPSALNPKSDSVNAADPWLCPWNF